MSGLTYEKAGVDYGPLDAFKRACQAAASGTAAALTAHGMAEPAGVRGESAYLIESADAYWAHVEEGLGTKNLVADAVLAASGKSFYRNIGIDTVATIVNDLITCGALPISVAMHAAVGDANWFGTAGGVAAKDLADGFAEGCRLAGAVWGGGETPALKGIVEPGAIVLAGSAMGRITPKSLRIAGGVRDGDAIVLVASSGVQTNGLTLCRAIADKLPQKFLTKMEDGRAYGEALLDASVIYVPLVAAMQKAGIRPHYLAHITGHGWRKLMRLDEPFVYEVKSPANVPEVFRFIAQHAGLDQREMYGTFNMGAGFAVYLDAADAAHVIALAGQCGLTAWDGGRVRKQRGRKAVVISDLGITYEAETLQLR